MVVDPGEVELNLAANGRTRVVYRDKNSSYILADFLT